VYSYDTCASVCTTRCGDRWSYCDSCELRSRWSLHGTETGTIRHGDMRILVVYPIIILWSPHLSKILYGENATMGITFSSEAINS
jgi:hypothetical protein